MRTAIPLALTIVACGHGNIPVKFETRCGLMYQGTIDEGADVPFFTQENIQQLEDMAIGVGLVECTKLKGYYMVVRPKGPWDLYNDGKYRSGSTYCNFMYPHIEVAAPFFNPSNATIHELHHVQQRCEPSGPIDEGQDVFHADWVRSGAHARIEALWHVVKSWGKALGQ